jgi:hypothetical protein
MLVYQGNRGRLAGLVAFAAFAIAIPASATTVTERTTGAACSKVSVEANWNGTGGCALLFLGKELEIAGPLGLTSICDHRLEGRVDSSGDGYLYQNAIESCSVSTEPCVDDGIKGHLPPGAWPVRMPAATAIEIRFCWTVGALKVSCPVKASIVEDEKSHRYTFAGGRRSVHRRCGGNPFFTLTGLLEQEIIESRPAIQIAG